MTDQPTDKKKFIGSEERSLWLTVYTYWATRDRQVDHADGSYTLYQPEVEADKAVRDLRARSDL